MAISLYSLFILYVLLIEKLPILNGQSIDLYYTWPYFGVFGGIMISLVLLLIFGRNVVFNLHALLLFYIPIYSLHQFEEHGYDFYLRPYHFIHFANHQSLGLEFNMNYNEYYLSPKLIYIINVFAIWWFTPISIFVSILYPKRNVSILMIGAMFMNGIVHCLSAIVHLSYNPGLITSIVLFIPYSLYSFQFMLKYKVMFNDDIAMAIVFGIWAHLVLAISMYFVVKGVITEDHYIYCLIIGWGLIPSLYWMMFSSKHLKQSRHQKRTKKN